MRRSKLPRRGTAPCSVDTSPEGPTVSQSSTMSAGPHDGGMPGRRNQAAIHEAGDSLNSCVAGRQEYKETGENDQRRNAAKRSRPSQETAKSVPAKAATAKSRTNWRGEPIRWRSNDDGEDKWRAKPATATRRDHTMRPACAAKINRFAAAMPPRLKPRITEVRSGAGSPEASPEPRPDQNAGPSRCRATARRSGIV